MYFITQWGITILLVFSVVSDLSIITMATAINKIVDGFPFPTILPIVGNPTYNIIAEVNLKLNSNYASVQSNLGCITLGLLQLTVSPAVNNTLSSIPFIVPVNPGSVSIIPAKSTGAQITELRYAIDTASTLFNEYDHIDKALRQIMLSTVDEMFIRTLQHNYVGYGLITTCTILDQLYTPLMPKSPPQIYRRTTLSFAPLTTSINQLKPSSAGSKTADITPPPAALHTFSNKSFLSPFNSSNRLVSL